MNINDIIYLFKKLWSKMPYNITKDLYIFFKLFGNSKERGDQSPMPKILLFGPTIDLIIIIKI